MKYYPTANIAGNRVTNANNYYSAGPHLTDIDQPDFRVDHNITDRQKFFARYSYRLTQDVPPALFPSAQTIAEGRVNQENHAHGAVADYTNTLSPTTIVNARLGFARTLFVYANQGLGFLPSSLGLPKTLDTAMDRAMFPGVTASGYASLGGNDHRRSAFMSYTSLANVTKIIGSHHSEDRLRRPYDPVQRVGSAAMRRSASRRDSPRDPTRTRPAPPPATASRPCCSVPAPPATR